MRTLVDTDIWSEIFKGKNATVLASERPIAGWEGVKGQDGTDGAP